MSNSELNDYFHNLWLVFTDDQKRSVINIMKSFVENERSTSDDILQHLHEPQAIYDAPMTLFKILKKKQKKALVAFIQASGVESLGGVTIEAYNKEIDEAEAAIERGEFYTHEEVIDRLNKRFGGR